MILLQIFNAFLRIGFFAIGGAYSFLPLLQKEIVEHYQWLTKDEFLDVLGMVQILPGAISIKFATYTGYKTAGILGAIVANVANLLPPMIAVLLASALYLRYRHLPQLQGAFQAIQLTVFAMILVVAFKSVQTHDILNLKNLLIILISFGLFLFTRIHPAIIIVYAGIAGASIHY